MPASGAGCGLFLNKRTRVVAEPIAPHFDSVLPQQRWRQTDRARLAVHLPRRTYLADSPGLRVLDLDPHLPASCERARECFLHVEDRSSRDPKLLEARQPLITGAFLKVDLDRPDELRTRCLTLSVGGESRIVGQLRRVDRLAESGVLVVGRDRHVDEAVANCERPIRSDGGVIVAFLVWDLAGRKVATRLIREQREQGIIQGDVDIATSAGG